MSNAHLEFLRAREIGDVVNTSLYFIRDHFKPIFRALIYIAGPVLVLSVIASAFFMSAEFSADTEVVPFMLGQNVFWMLISNATGMIAILLVMAVMYEYMFLCHSEGLRAYEPGEVWQGLRRRLLLYVVYGIIVSFMIFFGFMLFIVPGVYLMVALQFVYVIAFLEDRSISNTISRSYEFIKGHWWNTLGLMLIVYIIYYIISLIFGMPALIYGAFLGFMTATGGETGLGYFFSFVISFFSTLGYVAIIIPVAATVYQYFNIYERKYAPGLSKDIQSLKEDA